MKRWKDGMVGGMTEEQEKRFIEIEDGEEANAFMRKCYEENSSEEFKAHRAEKIKNKTWGYGAYSRRDEIIDF